ncbi:hypothetical protein JCM9492_11220 [Aquifex pyrophilus]
MEEEAVKKLKILELFREGLSYREIAERCGTTKDYVKKVVYEWRKRGKPELGIEVADVLEIPEPLYENERKPYILKGYRRIGIINDVHFPYHDKVAVRTALKALLRYEIDTLILNGDIVDFYSVSFWERRPDRRNLQVERDIVLKAFDVIRKVFPDAKIIYKEGNHEERLERFLMRKAPELWDVEELKTENFLRLSDFGIEYVKDKRRIQAGELDIIHGHEYRSYASVNIAVSYLRKAFRNVLLGHFHRKQEETKKDIRDELSGAWIVGCLCDLKPDYAPHNEWVHGFAFVELYENGHFSVKNHTIQGEEVF